MKEDARSVTLPLVEYNLQKLLRKWGINLGITTHDNCHYHWIFLFTYQDILLDSHCSTCPTNISVYFLILGIIGPLSLMYA